VPTFRIGADAELLSSHHSSSSLSDDEDEMMGDLTATTYRINKAGRMVQVDSSLFVRDLTFTDSGLYVCVANNSVGQDRFEIELLVRGK